MNTGWRKLCAAGSWSTLPGNARGSTLAICAAAVIPLLLIVGSGLDMSRAYMAKLRLQQACDAGSLAGRRVMQNDTLNSTVTTEANKFFNFNFPQNAFQTASLHPVGDQAGLGRDPDHRIDDDPDVDHEDLRLQHPAAVSRLQGRTAFHQHRRHAGARHHRLDGRPRRSACSSRRSSRCAPPCWRSTTSSRRFRPSSQAAGMRLRYGIVPYSITTHTGNLVYALNNSYINDDLELHPAERHDLHQNRQQRQLHQGKPGLRPGGRGPQCDLDDEQLGPAASRNARRSTPS